MSMHLHFEEIHQHQPDETQLMTSDRLLDIQSLIWLLHRSPEIITEIFHCFFVEQFAVVQHTKGTSFIV
jgi:hypothetical protein